MEKLQHSVVDSFYFIHRLFAILGDNNYRQNKQNYSLEFFFALCLKMILIYKGYSTDQHFLHTCAKCLPKFNLLSISNPSSLTLFSDLIFISFIFIVVWLFCWFFLSIIIAWNLSGFTIIMFSLNHCTAFSDSKVKLLINSSRNFSLHEIVLPSTQLCS